MRLPINLLSLSLLGHQLLTAQQTGRMETDRPDQTESPYLTKKMYLQGEIGFNYEKADGKTNWIHPTALWKYGLNDRFEFRLITELQTVPELTVGTNPPVTKRVTGMLPIQVGGKLTLCEEVGLIPKTSLIAHTALPNWGGNYSQHPKWAPNFRFTMQNTLSDRAALGYNLGAEWDGFTNTPDWIYTFAPGYNLGANGYAYVELYGSLRKGSSPQHSIAGGIAYYFTDDTKIDFSGSYGLTPAANDYYLAVGFSFRTPTKKK
ncbi:MAG: transporter [Bacteroidota bacterium]